MYSQHPLPMTFSSMRIVQLCDVRAAFSERVILSQYRTIFIEKNIIFGIEETHLQIYQQQLMKEIARLRSSKNTQQSQTKQSTQKKTFKSISSRFMEKPWGFCIPNKKKQELQKIRKIEIQFQNKALTSRINNIKSKRNNSSYIEPDHSYLKKPFHEQVRKLNFRIIREENKNQTKRIQQLRSSIDHKLLEREWSNRQTIRNLASKYNKREKKQSISHSIETNLPEEDLSTLQNYQALQKVRKIEKQIQVNGHKIEISLQQYSHVVMIVGRPKAQKSRVVMVVQRRKIQKILLQKCKGKLESFLNLLEYDGETNSLYYLTQDPESQDEFISDVCSQLDLMTLKKALLKQHQMLVQKHKETLNEINQNLLKDHTCTTNAGK